MYENQYVRNCKHIRKSLRLYHFLCGIKLPYKILLDANFVAMALQMNVSDLLSRLSRFLQTDETQCSFFMTGAALEELKSLELQTAVEFVRNSNIHVFSKTSDLDASQSILHQIGPANEGKFIVATQEDQLRQTLRDIPGVPLVYLNRSVLVFEELSKATLRISRQEEQAKMTKLQQNEKKELQSIHKEQQAVGGKEQRPQRLHKKAKGKNPLSCKKSQQVKKRKRPVVKKKAALC